MWWAQQRQDVLLGRNTRQKEFRVGKKRRLRFTSGRFRAFLETLHVYVQKLG